jgi:phage-related protein
MATSWPTLSVKPDPSSSINRNPRIQTFQGGDGYILRYVDGINFAPRTYTIVYKYLKPSDEAILSPFLDANQNGTSLLVPIWPKDATGAQTGYFYITQVSDGRSSDGVNYDATITLQEVYA